MGPLELPIEPKDIPRAGADERKPLKEHKKKQRPRRQVEAREL